MQDLWPFSLSLERYRDITVSSYVHYSRWYPRILLPQKWALRFLPKKSGSRTQVKYLHVFNIVIYKRLEDTWKKYETSSYPCLQGHNLCKKIFSNWRSWMSITVFVPYQCHPPLWISKCQNETFTTRMGFTWKSNALPAFDLAANIVTRPLPSLQIFRGQGDIKSNPSYRTHIKKLHSSWVGCHYERWSLSYESNIIRQSYVEFPQGWMVLLQLKVQNIIHAYSPDHTRLNGHLCGGNFFGILKMRESTIVTVPPLGWVGTMFERGKERGPSTNPWGLLRRVSRICANAEIFLFTVWIIFPRWFRGVLRRRDFFCDNCCIALACRSLHPGRNSHGLTFHRYMSKPIRQLSNSHY